MGLVKVEKRDFELFLRKRGLSKAHGISQANENPPKLVFKDGEKEIGRIEVYPKGVKVYYAED